MSAVKERLLTTSEVAHRWGCVERTVCEYIAAGHLEATKIGGQWRIEPAAVKAYEKRHSSKNVPAPSSTPGGPPKTGIEFTVDRPRRRNRRRGRRTT